MALSIPTPASQADVARAERGAVLSSLLAAALFAVMAVAVRAISARIPGPQIAFVRFATGLVVVAVLARFWRLELRPRRWGWLASRGLAGGLAVVAYFVCIEHVGVGVATLLNHTGPVWSLLFAWLLLGERPGVRALAALGLTMVGVALVVGGGTAGGGWFGIGRWELVGVFSAAATGVAVTSIRAVRRPSADGLPVEGSWTVFLSFTALGLVSTLPFLLGRWVDPTPREWGILLGAAAASIVAQLAMTRALAFLTAVGSGIVLQLTVVLSLLGGLWIYGEELSTRTALGALITMVGVMWMVLSPPAPPVARPPVGSALP